MSDDALLADGGDAQKPSDATAANDTLFSSGSKRRAVALPPSLARIPGSTPTEILPPFLFKKPDWGKWQKMDVATLWEVTCLAADIEPPRYDSRREILSLRELEEFPGQFHDIWDIVNRDIQIVRDLPLLPRCGRMLHSVPIANFAQWAVDKGIPIPEPMRDLANRWRGALGEAHLASGNVESRTDRDDDGARADAVIADDRVPKLKATNNSRAAVVEFVRYYAPRLRSDGDNLKSLSQKILDQIQPGCLGERGPITAKSIERMIPRGATGGRAKNGRKKIEN